MPYCKNSILTCLLFYFSICGMLFLFNSFSICNDKKINFSQSVCVENLSSIKANPDTLTSTICEEQVFVQTDRNRYHPGDTLFFQSYIKNRFSGVFESSSAALYVLLFNSEHHMVDSARFKINKALCPGWMAIPSSAKAGKYRLVAFTSKMQHYSPEEAFMVDLAVDPVVKDPFNVKVSFSKSGFLKSDTIEAAIKLFGPNGKPVSGQKFQGQLLSDSKKIDSDHFQTNDQGEATIHFLAKDYTLIHPQIVITSKIKNEDESFVKTLDVPWEMPQIHLHFLPEGGTLIDNIPQRIGFHATNEKGETIFIKGLLKLDDGTLVDSIRSGEYGPGMFSCKPRKGMYVELLQENSTAQKFPLPELVSQGICLRVIPFNEHTIAIEIFSNKKESENIHVEGLLQWNKVVSKDLLLDKKEAFLIKTDDLPAGIMDINVYNDKYQPVASRLCMVNAQKKLRFNPNIDSASFNSNEQTTLSFFPTDENGNHPEGVFSLAVVDSGLGINASYFIPDISYTFIDQPYFMDNLPLKALETGIENLSPSEKDLMMMVFGWKKFKSTFASSKSLDTTNFDQLKIHIDFVQKNRKANRKFNLYSLEGPILLPLKADENESINFPLDSLPQNTFTISIIPDFKNQNKFQQTEVKIPFNNHFFSDNKFNKSLPVFSKAWKNSYIQEDTALSFTEKYIKISPVTIVKKKSPVLTHTNEYEEMFSTSQIKTIDEKTLNTSATISDALFQNHVLKITNSQVFIRNPISPALIVLDGLPLYHDGFDLVKTIPPDDLSSINILSGSRGVTFYGIEAGGGVIFINTKARDRTYQKYQASTNNPTKTITYHIYRPDWEYYNPNKQEVDEHLIYQKRPTVYWAPAVYFNGTDPVKITFPNNKHAGTMMVIGNGISSSSLMGSFSLKYQTK